jgi:hypothetical protein
LTVVLENIEKKRKSRGLYGCLEGEHVRAMYVCMYVCMYVQERWWMVATFTFSHINTHMYVYTLACFANMMVREKTRAANLAAGFFLECFSVRKLCMCITRSMYAFITRNVYACMRTYTQICV